MIERILYKGAVIRIFFVGLKSRNEEMIDVLLDLGKGNASNDYRPYLEI